MNTKVILVHTGTIFPYHINNCISNLLRFNIDIHLILSKNLHHNIIDTNIKLVCAEDYEDNKYKTFDIRNHDINYKDNFWQRTSSRFFIINNYVQINNIQDFFHIENDVLLFSDLSKENEILKKMEHDMFVVIDSETRCIPSIMWFRNYNIINSLTDFIYSNNHNNDMSNIFQFYLNNKNKVSNLPILPSNSNLRKNTVFNYSNNFDIFNSIFDAAAIGQYLGGIDNVNYDSVGYISPDSIFDVSNFEYVWEDGIPYMIYNNSKIKINNLHIHSKKLDKINKK
jgi:hypothetical protein